jgi:hypothetical protein
LLEVLFERLALLLRRGPRGLLPFRARGLGGGLQLRFPLGARLLELGAGALELRSDFAFRGGASLLHGRPELNLRFGPGLAHPVGNGALSGSTGLLNDRADPGVRLGARLLAPRGRIRIGLAASLDDPVFVFLLSAANC